jgi:hypothetical protein
MQIRRGMSLASFALGCALILMTNAHCGEYLLLHYLLTPACSPSQVAGNEQADGLEKIETDALPTVLTEDQPSECALEPDPVVAIEVTLLPLPAPTCLEGDLNKDGKVDGLDVQILVNCLLKQQSS